ncbi:MAG: hypothetical protein IAF58_14325 [Leptolyngbya sp.]|nr:hypothetical protein [Candidatus Melainabacteria bacterium]
MPGTELDSRDSANYSLVAGGYIDDLESKAVKEKLETERHPLSFLEICASETSQKLFRTVGEESVDYERRPIPERLYANPADAVAHVSQERADSAMKELQRRVVESESERWSKIFEAGKCLAGLTAVKIWAPGFTPINKVPPLIEMQKTLGIDYVNVGRISQAKLLEAERLKYSGSCVGGLALGWGVSHLIDNTLFYGQQYKEGALVGDAAGIACGIMAPGWKIKAASVVATHVSGKLIDAFSQLQTKWNKQL